MRLVRPAREAAKSRRTVIRCAGRTRRPGSDCLRRLRPCRTSARSAGLDGDQVRRIHCIFGILRATVSLCLAHVGNHHCMPYTTRSPADTDRPWLKIPRSAADLDSRWVSLFGLATSTQVPQTLFSIHRSKGWSRLRMIQNHLTRRCSRRLADLFPPTVVLKTLPKTAKRALARRG